MDTKKLRQKILDLAIRGKLVPQDPNDEPASVLLERIHTEKERLISEGKIKRPKKSKTSSSESHYQNFEPPFEIPNSWEWVDFDCIFDTINSSPYQIKQSSIHDTGAYEVISQGQKEIDGYSDDETKVFRFNNGCVIFGDHTLVVKFRQKEFIVGADGVKLILPQIYPEYGYFLVLWKATKIESRGYSRHFQFLSSGKFPLPPFKEQQRVVKEITNWISLFEIIEINKEYLFEGIRYAKSKIIELAMQGKLVPQDPSDEPAADMLRRINPKAKIITDNPHLWNIPLGWVLGSLKEIVNNPSSKQFQILQSEIKQNGRIPVISQSSNFIEGYSENEDKAFHPNNGIVIFGDHTKNVKFFSEDFIIGADGVKLIDWDFNKRFLFYLIKYVSEKIPDKGYSRHFQYLLTYVVGLPPLNEQKRIVTKIEELYSCLDKTEASLQS